MTARSPSSPLHVEVRGEGDPPVVLVHGIGAHAGFWRKWVPVLARRHRVHAVDLMGFGRAPTPRDGDYSPLAQAGYLAEMMRSLEGEPPVLVGHSLGAGVAVAAVVRLMDEGGGGLPGGLVLVSGAVYAQRLPRFLSLARVRGIGEIFLVAPPPRFALRLGIRGIVADGGVVDREMVDTYREPLLPRDRRRAILAAARQLRLEDAEPLARRLPEIDIRTLLVWGEEDRIVPPENGRRLARALPRARLVTLPGIGHLPPEEAPDRSLEPVLEFLRGATPEAR
jgi:pimeloyl-ACP methyl ester carboxylesterase